MTFSMHPDTTNLSYSYTLGTAVDMLSPEETHTQGGKGSFWCREAPDDDNQNRPAEHGP